MFLFQNTERNKQIHLEKNKIIFLLIPEEARPILEKEFAFIYSTIQSKDRQDPVAYRLKTCLNNQTSRPEKPQACNW